MLEHICVGIFGETEFCAYCKERIPDGKPVPTQEEIDQFLATCEQPFAKLHSAMWYKAALRAYKGPWKKATIEKIWNRIYEELDELKEEIGTKGTPRSVLHEAADVANFLAVLIDLYETQYNGETHETP